METQINSKIPKLVDRFLTILETEGLLTAPERRTIFTNLKSLAEHGTLKPVVVPKLLDGRSAAEMLGLSYANFRKLETEGDFAPYFKRKMVGKSVRFRNTDIINYILAEE